MQHELGFRRQLVLRLLPPRLILVNGVDAGRSGLSHEREQHIRCAPTPQNEGRAKLGELPGECGEAMVEPPALRPADALTAGRLIIEHINGQHIALAYGSHQGWMVTRPQILPQPEE